LEVIAQFIVDILKLVFQLFRDLFIYEDSCVISFGHALSLE